MVRPMSGMHALAERMQQLLEAAGTAARRTRRSRSARLDRPTSTRSPRPRSRRGERAFAGSSPSRSTRATAWRPARIAERLAGTAGDGSAILAAEVDGEVRGLVLHGPSRDRRARAAGGRDHRPLRPPRQLAERSRPGAGRSGARSARRGRQRRGDRLDARGEPAKPRLLRRARLHARRRHPAAAQLRQPARGPLPDLARGPQTDRRPVGSAPLLNDRRVRDEDGDREGRSRRLRPDGPRDRADLRPGRAGRSSSARSIRGRSTRASAKIEKQLGRAVEKGKLEQRRRRRDPGAGSRRRLDYADLADCDLVIEAITEDLDGEARDVARGRRDRQAGGVLRHQHVLAGGRRRRRPRPSRPERFLGLHFFNPPR